MSSGRPFVVHVAKLRRAVGTRQTERRQGVDRGSRLLGQLRARRGHAGGRRRARGRPRRGVGDRHGAGAVGGGVSALPGARVGGARAAGPRALHRRRRRRGDVSAGRSTRWTSSRSCATPCSSNCPWRRCADPTAGACARTVASTATTRPVGARRRPIPAGVRSTSCGCPREGSRASRRARPGTS